MPQRDRTGPNGQGSMTGRGMGFCAGFNTPGFANCRFGRGRGFGFRARAQFMPVQSQVITEKEEKTYLQEELKALKEEMQEIEKRLKELKA